MSSFVLKLIAAATMFIDHMGLILFPHQMIFPVLAICITMFSFNFIGDGLRDALDPKLRD